MLKIRKEAEINNDLFQAPEAWKVVTINCVGAMGRGIALSCKQLYPAIYEDYRARCSRAEVVVGKLTVYDKERIILLPTKDHFKDPSRVDYVIAGIGALLTENNQYLGGVALPPLGMVNGWLSLQQRQECYLRLAQLLRPDPRQFTLYLPTPLYDECRAFFTQR